VTRRFPLVAMLAVAGCKEPVDAEPLGDYTTWKRIDVTGIAPGHGDTYRIVYINDVARLPPVELDTLYPTGSVIVKEIRDDVDGSPGGLRYVAIMRKVDDSLPVFSEEGGWLFSETDEPGGNESHRSLCWRRCHVAAPYNGAWYDYRD
jgi:hypothetical protein